MRSGPVRFASRPAPSLSPVCYVLAIISFPALSLSLSLSHSSSVSLTLSLSLSLAHCVALTVSLALCVSLFLSCLSLFLSCLTLSLCTRLYLLQTPSLFSLSDLSPFLSLSLCLALTHTHSISHCLSMTLFLSAHWSSGQQSSLSESPCRCHCHRPAGGGLICLFKCTSHTITSLKLQQKGILRLCCLLTRAASMLISALVCR